MPFCRLECGCTAEQEETSNIEHSDCMQQVKHQQLDNNTMTFLQVYSHLFADYFTLTFSMGGSMEPNETTGVASPTLGEILIQELNNRSDYEGGLEHFLETLV